LDSQAGAWASLADSPAGASLWWAWESRPLAAALIVNHPGRTAFLFPCPLEAPGVDRAALGEVVRAATGQALREGLHFVQVSLPSGKASAKEAAQAWRYRFVAELLSFCLDLHSFRPRGEPADLAWRRYAQFTEAELGELILATYEGSLDCPVLLPLRPAADILASHKAGGVFRPQSWWILDAQGEPAACVLVNDRPVESAAEVVYLGVRPGRRGESLCGWLLNRAAGDAAGRGLRHLLLACDSRNGAALRAYARAGFRRTDSRWLFAAIRGRD
jgi:ribosomal protein S18 acetylase RimI-like enzyme